MNPPKKKLHSISIKQLITSKFFLIFIAFVALITISLLSTNNFSNRDTNFSTEDAKIYQSPQTLTDYQYIPERKTLVIISFNQENFSIDINELNLVDLKVKSHTIIDLKKNADYSNSLHNYALSPAVYLTQDKNKILITDTQLYWMLSTRAVIEYDLEKDAYKVYKYLYNDDFEKKFNTDEFLNIQHCDLVHSLFPKVTKYVELHGEKYYKDLPFNENDALILAENNQEKIAFLCESPFKSETVIEFFKHRYDHSNEKIGYDQNFRTGYLINYSKQEKFSKHYSYHNSLFCGESCSYYISYYSKNLAFKNLSSDSLTWTQYTNRPFIDENGDLIFMKDNAIYRLNHEEE